VMLASGRLLLWQMTPPPMTATSRGLNFMDYHTPKRKLVYGEGLF